MSITIGQTLAGHYKIVKSLSSGGFGETYIAEDSHRPGNPKCVLKHLKPANNNSPESLQTARRLFKSEAQVLEKVGEHPQITRLLAYFEENEEFYLVEEFIDGHPLSAELPLGQRWSETQVKSMLEDMLGILEFVHGQGVIHRDIKPDNIIRRTSDNKLVLIDFGAIKEVQIETENPGIPQTAQTRSTIAIGTPGYMPTEQGRGKPRPSSDLYALGMIAIQALTGMYPHQLREDDETGEIRWQDQAEVSPELAAVLSQMIRDRFKERYQSATEVLTALRIGSGGTIPPTEVANQTDRPTEVANNEERSTNVPSPPQPQPPLPPEPQPPTPLPQPKPQNKTPMEIGATILTLLLLGGGGFLYVQAENARQQEIAAQLAREREAEQQRQQEAEAQRQREAQALATNQLGEQKLAQAKKEAEESGNLKTAISIAKEVPADSDFYREAQTAISQWEQDWQTQQNIFAQVEQAYNAGRWQEVTRVAFQLPQNPYWNEKVNPLYYAAEAEIKAIQAAEAERLRQAAAEGETTQFYCECIGAGSPDAIPGTEHFSDTNYTNQSCVAPITEKVGTWQCKPIPPNTGPTSLF